MVLAGSGVATGGGANGDSCLPTFPRLGPAIIGNEKIFLEKVGSANQSSRYTTVSWSVASCLSTVDADVGCRGKGYSDNIE